MLSELNLSVIPAAVCAVRPCVSCARHVGLLFWKRRRCVMLRVAFHILRVAFHMLRVALHMLCVALHMLRVALHMLRVALHMLRVALHMLRVAGEFESAGVALLLEAACSTCVLQNPAAAAIADE